MLLTGLQIGESPRWHDGRLWLANWGAGEILAVGPDGSSEVMLRIDAFPCCFDWLPDGRLLVVDGSGRRLLRQEAGGELTTVADLSGIAAAPWNEIVVDALGNAYVNSIGFDFPGGEFAPGVVALVAPDGTARQVADGVAFPNGMAISPDGGTLVVAESYASRLTAFDIAPGGDLVNRRPWAVLEDAAPDGICFQEHRIWYGDVPARRCVRVDPAGNVDRVVELDQGCFACAVGDGVLYMLTATWGPDVATARTGRVVTATL
ncbi:SMP-30/gluconolactonase/LRE family protein [Dactylosporangium roseum]|uniref:SMP-30/gluconolactonase/LRE family protein n=1 Tax=Dactylosporangium roseum TaxID=47989 RepID=A0ABY5ZEQ9_9ACTN|nr:SMP-30/gluconolactonase/LRE family protein [Dactylosporangium roseum]